MAFEDTIKEPWFIGVVAGVGALILILIVIIIILCCLWFRRKKSADEDEKKDQQHDIERDSSTPSSYQEMPEAQNWTLVQQNGIASVPASNDTPRLIKGDEPYVAGSSLIKMNEEIQKNGGPSSHTKIENHRQSYYKTEVEKTLEQNQNIDAFERSRKISNTSSEVSRGGYRGSFTSSGRFERASEVRESARSNQSFQKPRLANIQISQSKHSESNFNNSALSKDRVYLPERNDSTRVTQTSVYRKTASSQPYRIPEEDYSGIEMYSEEERYSWRTPMPTQTSASQAHGSLHRLSDGKVKNLTEKFETTEVSTADASAASRSAVENELREQLAERRISQRYDANAVPMSPRRITRDSQVLQDYDNPSANWQGKSSKGTIENRLNRIKKVGAVSVFPD